MDKNKVKVVPETKGTEPLKNKKMTIEVELERIFDPNRSENNLMMTMAACSFDDGENDVGEVLHGIPAHCVIRDKVTGEDWVLNYGNLFEQYMNARKNFQECHAIPQTAGEDHGEEIRDEHMGLDDGVIYDESGFSSGAGVKKNG
jgi:hypothetical protein